MEKVNSVWSCTSTRNRGVWDCSETPSAHHRIFVSLLNKSLALISLPHSQQPCTCPYTEPYQRTSPGPRLCIVVCNLVIFYGEKLLAPFPNPSWRTTPCRLSATAYSMYSQLPSISAGGSSIRHLRTRHAVVTGTDISW
jgi:hypothetical protein